MSAEGPRPKGIYAIADAEALGPVPVPEAAEAMAAAGVRWIQLRAKKASGNAIHRMTEEACRRLEGRGVALWLDDRVDLAAVLPVAGVHLGQRDLPARDARPILGPGRWIGLSTHCRDQVLAGAKDPSVDVLAVGPVFPTTGKQAPDPVVGLELVRWVRERTDKPLVAIGGITTSRLQQVLEAGADAAVVLGAACRGDVYRNCERLVAAAGGAV